VAYPGDHPGSFPGAEADTTETVDLGIRLGMEVSDQVVTFDTETVDVGIRLGLEVSDVVIHAVETVELGIGLGLRTYTPKAWGEDVRTGRPAPRIDIADRDGTLVATLPKSTLKPLTTGVNVLDRFGFTVDRNDDRARLIQPVAHEAYLYRGNVLMAKGPIGPGNSGDAFTSYDCADPRWHFADGRRRIGRIPKRQLLLNPGFTEGANGLAHWVGGWDDGSALESAPEADVVDESYARSGKALELGGVDKVLRGTETLETAAVFKGNRPYAWEPLADGFLPGGEAAITAIANMMTGPAPVVHITGHTADADAGDGQALSERRALAAKAVVLARWPAAVVTTEGKGETEPAVKGHTEAAYRKNRRVVFDFDRNVSAVGHRQFYYQWVTVTQPTSAKVPLPLTFAADMRIIEWLGAPGDGWAILVRAKRGSTVIDEANATMDEFTPRVRWAHYEATVEIPADGIATAVQVRLYPPAGSSRWANAGLWPQDQLGFFDVDQALIVKGIVEHVQDESLGHGDLGIGTRTPLTGVPRTREYPYHERMPADTAMEWFTSIDKGMDIDYDQDRNQVVTHYPRQGTSADLALVHGGRRSNVVAYKPLSTSTLALASNVIVQADGSGASRPEGYARDSAALGGALVEAVISAEEETPLSELDEGAASALAASLRARPGWEVTVSPDWTTRVLDQTGKGDTLRLVLPDEDVDGPHRLVSSEWNPETDIVTLTLIEEA
jgi:hypothetical protein